METYIVKIIRRREQDAESLLAGIIEDVYSGRTVKFSDADWLLEFLRLKEKKKGGLSVAYSLPTRR